MKRTKSLHQKFMMVMNQKEEEEEVNENRVNENQVNENQVNENKLINYSLYK